ncbi:MAG TPA: hypothetical protein PK808_05980 [Polymorphobacter sp.]|jgi:hypothetical protein|nr:hypothetical protein [Polymorphobacter sp.]
MERMTDAQTEAFIAARKSRNRALGLVLGGLAVLFFLITVVKFVI